MGRLRQHPEMASCTNEFATGFHEIMDDFIAASLDMHGLKATELGLFTEAIEEAKAEGAAEAQVLL